VSLPDRRLRDSKCTRAVGRNDMHSLDAMVPTGKARRFNDQVQLLRRKMVKLRTFTWKLEYTRRIGGDIWFLF
jgi:hypothetical protein